MAIRRGRPSWIFLCLAGAMVAGCADEVVGGSAGSGGTAGQMGSDAGRRPDAAMVSPAVDATDGPALEAAIEGSADAAADGGTDAADESADATADGGDAMRRAQTCVETCQGNQDCMSSQAVGAYECDLDRHRCVLCRDDLTCAGIASEWLMPCVTAADCDIFGNVCIDVAGSGRCAFTSGSPDCLDFSDDIAVTEFATSMAVMVCGDASKKCLDGACVGRCGPQSCTPEQGGRVCNDSTGRCECAVDADCAGGIGVSRCNLVTKQCECSSDDDCARVGNADVCVAGQCGCSSVAACTHPRFSGTALACE